ncbi:MAG: hypothetical protein GY810_03155 [Aureispira sp.]|nr:hypothetical protein [Aureispira sp.]
MSDEIIAGMLVLKEALRRERKMKLLVLLINCLLAIGLLMAALFAKSRAEWLFLVLSGMAFSVAFLFGRSIWKEWDLNTNPIMDKLHNNNRSIVWVYTIKIDFSPLGVQFWNQHTLSFRMHDGEELQMRAYDTEIPDIERALKQFLPHTTFGYTKEREQWYIANPMLLVRGSDEN